MIYLMEVSLIVQADSEDEALQKTSDLRNLADDFDYEHESYTEITHTYTEDQWRNGRLAIHSPETE